MPQLPCNSATASCRHLCNPASSLNQVIGSLLRLRCRRENGPLIGLENLQPRRDVLSMILARSTAQSQMCQSESSREFGNQFLNAVRVIPKPFAQFPIATRRGRSPMAGFMTPGTVIVHRREECPKRRQSDRVAIWRIECAILGARQEFPTSARLD